LPAAPFYALAIFSSSLIELLYISRYSNSIKSSGIGYNYGCAGITSLGAFLIKPALVVRLL
jgi:hypothetical protein